MLTFYYLLKIFHLLLTFIIDHRFLLNNVNPVHNAQVCYFKKKKKERKKKAQEKSESKEKKKHEKKTAQGKKKKKLLTK